MDVRKHSQLRATRVAATGLLAIFAIACSSDGSGDDPGLGMDGISGAGAAVGAAPAGTGAAGMTQVGAGSGGLGAGASGGSAGVTGGAGGVAGAATGGSGGSGSGGTGGASGSGGSAGASGGDPDGGLSGEGGASGGGGMSSEPDGGTMNDDCDALPSGRTPPYMPVYRVPLRVHTTRSDLTREQLCGTLEEVNEIWWTQAAVCFEIEIVGGDEVADTGMDLWFERSSPFPNGVEANGVYSGPHEIYSLDEPSLNSAPNPVEHLPARTAAHELGHGLGLQHQNCGTACNDLLMTSGRRGFALVTGSPASTDEHARSRDRASDYALSDMTRTVCGPPVFRDDAP